MDLRSLSLLLRRLSGETPERRPVSRSGIRLYDGGHLVELLANPQQTRCPHCNRPQPLPELKTRRRRLYEARTTAGAFLHLEIDS